MRPHVCFKRFYHQNLPGRVGGGKRKKELFQYGGSMGWISMIHSGILLQSNSLKNIVKIETSIQGWGTAHKLTKLTKFNGVDNYYYHQHECEVHLYENLA